jgi:hypothetical protein
MTNTLASYFGAAKPARVVKDVCREADASTETADFSAATGSNKKGEGTRDRTNGG